MPSPSSIDRALQRLVEAAEALSVAVEQEAPGAPDALVARRVQRALGTFKLSGQCRIVVAWLAAAADRAGRVERPAVAELAAQLGMGERALKTACRILIEEGAVQLEVRGSARGERGTVYRLGTAITKGGRHAR